MRDLIKEILERQSNLVASFFQLELANELEAQGHRDTGALIDSIQYEILMDADIIRIVFTYLYYGDIVNDGVTAAKIPFGQSSGAKTSLYIEALKEWAKRKGMKNPLNAAFAIAKTHKKEGMPSQGSYKFSNNGRRKEWRAFTLQTYLPQSLQIFADADLQQLINIILTKNQ